jgi:hypothetical protein
VTASSAHKSAQLVRHSGHELGELANHAARLFFLHYHHSGSRACDEAEPHPAKKSLAAHVQISPYTFKYSNTLREAAPAPDFPRAARFSLRRRSYLLQILRPLSAPRKKFFLSFAKM